MPPVPPDQVSVWPDIAEATAKAAKAAMQTSVWLSVAEAANHLRVSQVFLNKYRVYGGGPRFSKLGGKRVIYNRADLDAWAMERMKTSTSDEGPKAKKLAS